MEQTELKRRGRPPSMSQEERRRRIVAAAEETFTSRGYSAASMDDVVRACGMSKKTVYEMFDTKEQLFNEVVALSLESAPSLDWKDGQTLEGELLLRNVLRSMAAFILSPRQVALTRLVLAESPASPELGSIFYEAAVVRGQSMLAEAIRRIGSPVSTDVRHSEHLADLLIGTLLGPQFFSSLLGRTPAPTQDEIHARIDWLFDVLGPTLMLGKNPTAN
ncbi:TetR/AcrR family transcriptional regulator [Aureimonas sp. SK2]|uniref:TetR/AcrR family transcriptional regulator n=1 Tax=Aureimonas sp. SK2 TaxID=3015992 RepID=UPI00244459EF|nr:TetR/AcrR family transcriptional regulator [Aureimonas sp. SK2]